MDIIYIGALFAAVAFAIVVVYICFVLKRVTNTMKSLGSTLGEVEKQFEYVTPTLLDTIRETDKLVNDTEEKLEASDSLFNAIAELGVSVNTVNSIMHDNFGKLSDEELDEKLKPYIEGIKWSEAVTQLYSTYKENNRKTFNEVIVRHNNEIAKVSEKEGSR